MCSDVSWNLSAPCVPGDNINERMFRMKPA
jgi:hypothetical protein